MKRDRLLNILKIVVVAAIFLAAVLNYKRLSQLDIRLLVASASSLLIAELLILGVYVVKAILLVLPASVIYVSVGVALDWERAVILNMLGIAIEVTVTYFLGKFLGKSAVENKIRGTKAGDKLLNMQNKNKNLAIFTMRLIPAFPIDFSSLFMGAFDFNFLPYFLFSVLGLAPRVIAFTILGDKIYAFIPMKYIILIAIIALPIAVIFALVKKRKTSKTMEA